MNHENDSVKLSDTECATLLRIARDALTAYVNNGDRIAVDDYPLTAALMETRGAFVTLHWRGQLRGCIGSMRSTVSLAESVRDNAINAASRDPRFSPVSLSELPDIRIEISALGRGEEPGLPFIRVNALDEIQLGRDGLYLSLSPSGGGVLLPQVPEEQGWTLEEYLDGICRKSGAPRGAWQAPGNKLYRFTAQVMEEGDSRLK